MKKFIKKNFTTFENIRSLLLICFIIVHVNEFFTFTRIPLGVSVFGFSLIIAYHEDLEDSSKYVISEEYKKNSIHSLFNPFSWEKEWKYHFEYFSTLVEQRKIFNPFYTVGYALILFPTRIWTHYLLFNYKRTLIPVMLAFLYLSRIYIVLSFMSFSLASIFSIVFIGNFYVASVKAFCKEDDHFKEIAINLCLNKNLQYFFLGDNNIVSN